MTPEQIEKLRNLLYIALIPTEALNKSVFKSSIKYAVVLDTDGKLVISDWLNDYPEIKKEIEEAYLEVLKNIE
jgi:hypothetical protein